MKKPEILKLIEDSGLPSGVKEYCANAAGSGLSSTLKTALRKDAACVVADLDGLIARAGGFLACSKEEVLFATGFNKNNASPERFEAALAEIRAAAFLDAEGFTGLKLIGPGMKRTADLRAVRAGGEYVFEVRCLKAAKSAVSVDRLGSKYDKKVRQVNSSRKEYGCRGGGMIFVVDPFGLAPAEAPVLKELARGLYVRKNEPLSTHICVLSGSAGAVHPAW